jgi:hypothetical protein
VTALKFAGRAFARASHTASDTAHIAAIPTSNRRIDTASTQPECNAVGIHGDGANQIEQFHVYDIGEPVNMEDLVRSSGRFEGDAKGANAAPPQTNKKAYGLRLSVFEMFDHQLGRALGDRDHILPASLAHLSQHRRVLG